jgi:hypothetical protein
MAGTATKKAAVTKRGIGAAPAAAARSDALAFPGAKVINGRNYWPLNDSQYVPGAKLRAILGISAVTLWRWRHANNDKPQARTVQEWLEGQPETV